MLISSANMNCAKRYKEAQSVECKSESNLANNVYNVSIINLSIYARNRFSHSRRVLHLKYPTLGVHIIVHIT